MRDNFDEYNIPLVGAGGVNHVGTNRYVVPLDSA